MTISSDLWDEFAPAPPGTHPPLDFPGYTSTRLRHPRRPPVVLDPAKADATELTGPVFGESDVRPEDSDLTIGPGGEAVGQRIIVTGRLLDSGGRPIPDSLVEIWQANASGRYRHVNDQWPGTLDPNFTGGGRAITDADGRYRFTTIRPGAYPWGNHPNAWRPAHIHFSLFGRSFTQRLVTQMYFPDDPLFFQDPMLESIADPAVRARLVAGYAHDVTEPSWALGFRFDIVLRGRRAHRGTPIAMAEPPGLTPAQTVGPFLHIALADPVAASAVPADTPGACEVTGRVLDGEGAPVADALVETWQIDGHFGRCATDPDGRWTIRTVKPPSVATCDGTPQAAHLVVSVFARGLLDRVVTRLYFGDEPDANAADPTLAAVGDDRRGRLVAEGDEARGYRLDIHLQGDDESVFFAI